MTYHFSAVNYGNSNTTASWVTGINDSGLVVGEVNVGGIGPSADQAYVNHKGTFSLVSGLDSWGTTATGLTERGTLVGYYAPAPPSQQGMGGFVYDAINDTGFAAIRVPGAAYTEILGANDYGSDVGYYADTAGNTHGFILGHRGQLTTVDEPAATSTHVTAINDSGTAIGSYQTPDGQSHDFIRAADGTTTTLNVPGATSTVLTAINSYNQIAGDYTDASGNNHGFVYTKGKFMTIDVPGASYTALNSIDDFGDIAGGYNDASSGTHSMNGFVAATSTTRLHTLVGGPELTASLAPSSSSALPAVAGQPQGFASASMSMPETGPMPGIVLHG